MDKIILIYGFMWEHLQKDTGVESMNKYDFITELQKHLTGKVSPQKVQELTRYYQDYIDTEIRKGKTEEEVLSSLGEPRLLAKSIVTAEGMDDYREEDYRGHGYANEVDEDDIPRAQFVFNGKVIPRWKIWAVVIAVVFVLLVILSIVGRLLGFAFMLIFKYVLPILIPVIIVYLIYILFFDRR